MLAAQVPTGASSLEQLGTEARAEFERLRAFLDLVDEPLPTQIGRYQIERVLGRGGMGVVHLASDPELNRSVALKLVHAGPFVNRERLHARLQREARVLARLRHPNVVGVYDVGTHEGELFVAMEYVAGTNLRVWRDAEPRTPAQVLSAYLQAAHGLSAVHRAGIVHRDFKPDNVLIADDGRVLVGDFGLADDRDLDVEPDVDAVPDIGRTQTGALMGTLRYMAPERLCGESASAASDQFEFCVSLWEALTGQRPFVGEQRDALLVGMTHSASGGAKLERRIRRVLERGLAREPGQRFPDFDALIDALEYRSQRGRWLAGFGLALIAGFAIARNVLDPDICEIAERIDALGEQVLVLPEGSPDSATEVVQARFDRMIVELSGEAVTVCRIDESDALARLDRWVDVLELVVEHSAELPITRTLDTLSELEFERDREPPKLVHPEVARLLDEARMHTALGRMAEAEQATEQADAIATGRSDQAEVSLRRGQLAAWRGRPQTALEHYEDAIDNAEAAGLDRSRLAAHLLAAPLALDRVGQREQADHHHQQAALLLERLDVPDDDSPRVDHDQHEAMVASKDGNFEVALDIQQRVLDRRVEDGDPLAIAGARTHLALIHHRRSEAVKDSQPDVEAAEAGYRQVLVELDALGVGPSHATRLMALANLGLLLFTPDASPEQREQVRTIMSAVVEAGPSSKYVSAMHVLVGLLVVVDVPSPEQLVDAERLTATLLLELQAEDLAPRDRLDAWTIVASLHALEGDQVAFEAADAKTYELAQSAVDQGVMTIVERDVHLAAHTMQVVGMFERSNPDQARRLLIRASELAAKLPRDTAEKPDVGLLVAHIAAAVDALDHDVTR